MRQYTKLSNLFINIMRQIIKQIKKLFQGKKKQIIKRDGKIFFTRVKR